MLRKNPLIKWTILQTEREREKSYLYRHCTWWRRTGEYVPRFLRDADWEGKEWVLWIADLVEQLRLHTSYRCEMIQTWSITTAKANFYCQHAAPGSDTTEPIPHQSTQVSYLFPLLYIYILDNHSLSQTWLIPTLGFYQKTEWNRRASNFWHE